MGGIIHQVSAKYVVYYILRAEEGALKVLDTLLLSIQDNSVNALLEIYTYACCLLLHHDY